MTKYTFTLAERERIRSWLEKRPNAETLSKQWPFEREDGSTLPLTRCTQYIPGGKWKVRIAYCQADGYPIMTSGPLKSNIDQKVGKQKKAPMLQPDTFTQLSWKQYQDAATVQKQKDKFADFYYFKLKKMKPVIVHNAWADVAVESPNPSSDITYTEVEVCSYCGYATDQEKCNACTVGAP